LQLQQQLLSGSVHFMQSISRLAYQPLLTLSDLQPCGGVKAVYQQLAQQPGKGAEMCAAAVACQCGCVGLLHASKAGACLVVLAYLAEYIMNESCSAYTAVQRCGVGGVPLYGVAFGAVCVDCLESSLHNSLLLLRRWGLGFEN
jgi:hypothetical protein